MSNIELIHEKFYKALTARKELDWLRGVWSVYYVAGAKKFKSLGSCLRVSRDHAEVIEKMKSLEQVEINEGFGSNGWAYKVFLNDQDRQVCFLNNTYNDPRGAVIIFDKEIGQKNTAFIAVRDSNRKVIGIIMLFGEGATFEETLHLNAIKTVYMEHQLYFQTIIEMQQLKNIESIFEQRHEVDNSSIQIVNFRDSLRQILNGFLEINKQIDIPFFYILNKSEVKPEYIALSERVLETIEYELRFCSYLASKPSENCHFAPDSMCEGSNFLKEFFSGVISSLTKKTIPISFNEVAFVIELYASTQDEIPDLDFQLAVVENPFGADNIASEKYENEVLIQKVMSQINKVKNIIVGIIYRKDTNCPAIAHENCYRSGDYRTIIQPSNYLPYYYDAKYPNDNLLDTYPPLDGLEITMELNCSDTKHVLSMYWKKNQYLELLSKHILRKNESEISKLLELISHSYANQGAYDSSEEKFKIYGIKKQDLETSPIAQSYIKYLENRYLSSLQMQESMLYATRAAIAQVMARNMSHNIGSHVLSRLLTPKQIEKIHFKKKEGKTVTSINEINEILKNSKVFYQCLNVVPDEDVKGNEFFEKSTNESLLATFFAYLKARMDYLADVTTSTPVIEHSKGVYNEIVKPFISNRVLNDRISGIDDFKYEIIVCRSSLSKNADGNIHNTEKCLETECGISATNDIIFSIPNDVLGAHAFYTILENIIRNTAKHAGISIDSKTIFTIKVEEVEHICATENGSRLTEFFEVNTSLDEWYAVSIFDNCNLSTKEQDSNRPSNTEERKVHKLVKAQNELLNNSILKNNQLRHGGWGLIEMDASAAYLRKIPVELIDSEKYQIADLTGGNFVSEGNELCIFQAYAEQDTYLGYRFFIRKPQEILIVGDDSDLGIEKLSVVDKVELFNKYKHSGVCIYNKELFMRLVDGNSILPHKLIVIAMNGSNLKNSVLNNSCLTKRINFCSSKLTLSSEDPEGFKLALWVDYYRNIKAKSYNGNTKLFDSNEIVFNDTTGCNRTNEMHGVNYCTHYSEENKYIEISTSATQHYVFNKNIPRQSDSFATKVKKKIHQIQEAAAEPIDILVIDERIQEFSINKYPIESAGARCNTQVNVQRCFHGEGGVPYEIIYRRTNIKVPQKGDCNLNAQNFNENDSDSGIKHYVKIIDLIQESVSSFSKKFSNPERVPHFFIVIHLGIIEKLIGAFNGKSGVLYQKDNMSQTKTFITEILLNGKKKYDQSKEDLSKYYDHIIITSGRGTPKNVPQDIRYLNYSVISQYMITLRNKYAFTEALYNARKINERYSL